MKYFRIACILPHLLQGTRFSTSFDLSLFDEKERHFILENKRKMELFNIDESEKLTSGSFGDVNVFKKKNDSSGKKFVMKSCKGVPSIFEIADNLVNEKNYSIGTYNMRHQDKPFGKECNEFVSTPINDYLILAYVLDDAAAQFDVSRKQIINEIKVVADINGRGGNHFATVEGFIVSDDEQQVTHIVYEHGGTELFDYIFKNSLPKEDSVDIVKKMAIAIAMFHSFGWIHYDIKCENFLINSQSEIRLIDFGTAAKKGEFSPGGTVEYFAPERLEDLLKEGASGQRIVTYEYGEASDVWSLGVCLYGIITKRSLYSFVKNEDGQYVLDKGSLMFVPQKWYLMTRIQFPPLKKLLQGMLNMDVAKRFSMQNVTSNVFFTPAVLPTFQLQKSGNGFIATATESQQPSFAQSACLSFLNLRSERCRNGRGR